MIVTWRGTIILTAVAVAVLGTVLGLTLGNASGGGSPRYEVTVRFNTSVTQSDIEDVDRLLRANDDDLDLAIMESFPPIGRALLETDEPAFCSTAEAELTAKSYIDSVSCGPWQEEAIGDPDTPVTSER
jgi:hypothetical protein